MAKAYIEKRKILSYLKKLNKEAVALSEKLCAVFDEGGELSDSDALQVDYCDARQVILHKIMRYVEDELPEIKV